MAEKKSIKIGFVDFWNGFVPEESLFYKMLSKHFEPAISDTPDFLFCSTFGDDHLKYDCVKIFYTGENQVPDFNLYDYALGFEYLEFGDRYLRFPHYLLNPEECRAMEHKHEKASVDGRTGFCSYVCSNSQASAVRDKFYDKLSSYRTVSSGGRHRNNVGGPVIDKLEFLSKHKFNIAFENASHPGYTTEKIVQAFASGTIPIYWGDPLVARTFNTEAFVNVMEYGNWDEALERIRAIDNDDELLISMLRTPALVDGTDSTDRQLAKLEDFLLDIFGQTPETAFRRDRGFWGERYARRIIKEKRAYARSLRGLLSRIYKTTLWKSRRRNGLLWGIDKLTKSGR